MNGTGLGPQLALTPGILSTLAGTSSSPNTNGDGGPAIDATIFGTSDITIDSIGNIYLADIGGQEVRKIDASTGIISRIAGQGTSGYGYGGDGGPAINSFLNAPQDVALDSANNLYIADRQNHVVRKIDGATGIISTVAGQYYSSFTLQPPSDGDGGPATQALLNEPTGLAFDSAGNLYIADAAGSQIRKVDAVTNTISTVAGTGARGYTGDGGPATSAVLDLPEGVAVDQAGNVYFTDDQNSVVRRVDAVTGIITTYAGNPNIPLNQNILLSGPATSINIAATYIKFDAAGNLYITGNDAVRRVDAVTKIMTSIASGQTDEDYGTVSAGDGYPAIGYPNAGFDNPVGIAIDSSGSLLINDNAYLRKVDTTTSAVYFLQPTALSTLDAANDPQTVNVGNIGNAALTLPALGSGTNATVSPASFLFDSTLSNSCPQVSSGSSPATVAPGDSCDLALDFQPLVSGKITGSLVLTDNTLNSGPTTSTAYAVQSIPVQGIGTGGATLLPNALNFGNVAVGTSSATQTATLTNADPSYALYLSAPSLTDSTDFTESDNCNSLVPANASCTLTFTFTPQSAGALSSTFTISDSAHGTHYSIALAGDGISASAPQALLSPGTLSFTTTAGTAAATQMATLTNKGTAALALSSIAITGTNSTAFAQTNTCGSSLAAGASCTVTVSFTATSTGSYSATLTATDNASPATQSIQLTALVTTGSTGAPAATLTPATLNFGSVQTGAKSTAQSATLTNAGDAALTITSVSLMGTNSAAFATTNTCGSTLAAGASCAISVTFDPTTAGTDGATLSVSDNAPGSPQTSSLVGVATAPPAAADFSIAATPASQSVTSGSSAVYQVNLASLNGAFTQPVTLAASGLPAGSTVSFSPTSVTPGSAGSSSTMTIQTTAQQAFVQEDRVRWPISAGLVSVALLILPFRRRKRIFLGLGCLLLVLGVSGVMTACGGGFALPQVKATSATYTVTVTGTSGSLQHSTSVQITVR
jgi:sugar lactone lactonase YvrE